MTEIELLSWARGPGLQIATIIFVAGVVIRIFEISGSGQKGQPCRSQGAGDVQWSENDDHEDRS